MDEALEAAATRTHDLIAGVNGSVTSSPPTATHRGERLDPDDDVQRSALRAACMSLHRSGVAGFLADPAAVSWRPDIQQVVVDWSVAPYRRFSSTRSLAFRRAWDDDNVALRSHWRLDVLTFTVAQQRLAELERATSHWYAPIDFGFGLTAGAVWATESGTGRWDVLNSAAVRPHVQGARVLDLGANNGLNGCMMLRYGATSVVGYELDPVYVAAAPTIRRIFEWMDLVDSYDLVIEQRDMRDALEAPTDAFDVVTAFCSLYYLAPDDIAALVRRAIEIAPVLIVQANESKQIKLPGLHRDSATHDYLASVLQAAGFEVSVRARKGLNRPLLIGRRPPRG